MMKNLHGKTAIITGASTGIGRATALEMARLGVKLVLVARNEQKLGDLSAEIRSTGQAAIVCAGDVTRFKVLKDSVDLCLSTYGQLDFLVNNAGRIDPISRLAESDPEEWAMVADTNYKGVYFGLRAALPAMLSRQSGVIVNVSSGAATSALEGWSHYCSSKAAALSLTRCAHKEYRSQGLSVVGLSPGTVATDMQVEIKESGINPVSQLDPSVHIAPEIPARAIAWLCAGNAGQYGGTDFSLKQDGNIELVDAAFREAL